MLLFYKSVITCALYVLALGGPPVRAQCTVCTIETNAQATGGDGATAMGRFSSASGPGSTAMGLSSTASGRWSTAMGDSSRASGRESTAMGFFSQAAGTQSTAMNTQTIARGAGATSMGAATEATADFSVAMGSYVEATELESLVTSGNIFANNVNLRIEGRLAANVTDVRDTTSMLEQLRALQLVEYSPSRNLCAHKGIAASVCDGGQLRTVGLLSSQVAAAIPEAVTSGSSLRLTDAATDPLRNAALQVQARSDGSGVHTTAPTPRVLESVEGVKSLDLQALLTRVVGAIQALDKTTQAQTATIQDLKQELRAQAALNQQQQEMIRTLLSR